jgi:HEAT repeats
VASCSDQEALSRSVTDDALIAAVAGRNPKMEPAAALKELARRKSPVARKAVSDVLADRTAPLELRTTAARALGKGEVPGAESALIAALDAEQPALLARAAESLGRIGSEKALSALRRVKLEGAAGRMIQFSRTLIAYRLGLDEERLEAPPETELLDIEQERAASITFERVEPEAFRAADRYLKDELPAIPLAERGSVRFSCRHEHLWIALTKEVEGAGGAKRVAEGSAVVAVVLKESTCPEGWYIYEYILSHPRGAKKAEIFGVRPTGDLSHFGELDLKEVNVTVRLRAFNTPRLPAIDLEADYRGREGTFNFKRALVATGLTGEQTRPAEPRGASVRLR